MSSIIKCANGHFYDADKSRDCPYCKKQEQEREKFENIMPGRPIFPPAEGRDIDDEKTVAMMPVMNGEVVLGAGHQGGGRLGIQGMSADDDGVTVALFSQARGTAYITGWLVGVQGPVKGRDYRIHHGKNWVGRSYNSDVVISEGDYSVAERNQCAIVYDGKGNKFYILQGSGTTTYLNDKLVEVPMEIHLGDRIGMGNCIFEFVPFCREGHKWDEDDLET